MGRSLFLPLLSKLVTIKMHTIKVITTITSIFASSGRLSKYQEATLFESMHDVIIIISLTSLNCFAKTLASIVRSSFLQHDQATRWNLGIYIFVCHDRPKPVERRFQLPLLRRPAGSFPATLRRLEHNPSRLLRYSDHRPVVLKTKIKTKNKENLNNKTNWREMNESLNNKRAEVFRSKPAKRPLQLPHQRLV